MYVFLPREGTTLQQVNEHVSEQQWENITKQFKESSGTILIPKFKLEYSKNLADSLKHLGMGIAFDPIQADLSKMTDTPAFISKVLHKTYMDVNEEGTEAAAVTAVETVATSAELTQPFYLEVNRPFLLIIAEETTGAILFMGNIVEPS